jgi:cbb3-type cytochrome oxidase maturation protein
MEVLVWMIPISLMLGLGFVAAFFWAVNKGQLENLDEQATKILIDFKNVNTEEDKQ